MRLWVWVLYSVKNLSIDGEGGLEMLVFFLCEGNYRFAWNSFLGNKCVPWLCCFLGRKEEPSQPLFAVFSVLSLFTKYPQDLPVVPLIHMHKFFMTEFLSTVSILCPPDSLTNFNVLLSIILCGSEPVKIYFPWSSCEVICIMI